MNSKELGKINKVMKKITILLSVLLFCLVGAQAQILEPVKWKTELKKISGNEAEIVFSATIDKGWHVYSVDMGDDGPVSASFHTDVLKGAQLVGKLTPRSKVTTEYDKMFEMNLRFFEGKTQTEVAEEIHISQAQVSRLEKNALKTMRNYLN